MLWLLRVEFYGTLKCWSEGCFCCQPEVAHALQGVGISVGFSGHSHAGAKRPKQQEARGVQGLPRDFKIICQQ